ncbi:MAG: BphX family protein [Acidimicrobiales bacterium]
MIDNHSTAHTSKLAWWMRVVGVFYLLQFVMMAVVRAPIRTAGPEGALAQADAGEPVARFLVDTWLTLGLEVGAIGVAVLVASRHPGQARGVVWTVLAIELGRGILLDLYMLSRGTKVSVYGVWIVIHALVIVTGLRSLRGTGVGDVDQARTPSGSPASV